MASTDRFAGVHSTGSNASGNVATGHAFASAVASSGPGHTSRAVAALRRLARWDRAGDATHASDGDDVYGRRATGNGVSTGATTALMYAGIDAYLTEECDDEARDVMMAGIVLVIV